MNEVGLSSACFYPLETENSLARLKALGVKKCELFIHSFSEMTPEFTDKIKRVRDEAEMMFLSLHPFTAFAESYCLFSSYERRFIDTLPFYRRYFEICAEIGAPIFVLHGEHLKPSIDFETYIKRYEILFDSAAELGVTLCHENVVAHTCQDPAFMRRMADALGKKFRIVYDLKQARRSGFTDEDFLPLLADCLEHVHVSDYDDTKDCVPPFEGKRDLGSFMRLLRDCGYTGDYIVELYRWSWTDESQLTCSLRKTQELVDEVFGVKEA